MKLLCGVLFFAGVFALSSAKSARNKIGVSRILTNTLTENRANNPDNVAPCFGIYLPLLVDIAEEYEKSYEQCNTEATAQNALLNLEAQGNQTLISATAESVCSSMSKCSEETESLQFLDCYSSIGDGNIKTVYALTYNATEVAANLREAYRIVQNNLGVCQNTSERAYVEGTANTNEALNYCLANGTPPPPETTTPGVETSTPEATTVDPEVTTEQPAGPEEEDLSRIAPSSKRFIAKKFNKLNRRYKS